MGRLTLPCALEYMKLATLVTRTIYGAGTPVKSLEGHVASRQKARQEELNHRSYAPVPERCP